KVDTGFPQENAINREQLECFPIQRNRKTLQCCRSLMFFSAAGPNNNSRPPGSRFTHARRKDASLRKCR
ncbi:hypothetical protein, partial [Bradyrhizobium sp.]|uniref:hypothetical protein n=1 Tax=Bradyrhizobium sp. TaxID=376 RepID=UPI003C590906